ncbi:MAG: DNA cytosine methyltransferase [Chloroflexota bacterium]
MKVASLFSGAGGLDLGFGQAGFDIVWAINTTNLSGKYSVNNLLCLSKVL